RDRAHHCGHLAIFGARPADHSPHLHGFRHHSEDYRKDSSKSPCTRRGSRRMKPGKEGYRVAVVGASSLLGKELVSILEEGPEKGRLRVSRLLTFEADDGEPELPIIDLSHIAAASTEDSQVQVSEGDLDFAFLCARLPQLPEFLVNWQRQGDASRCMVIDVIGEGLAVPGDGVSAGSATGTKDRVGIPFLEHRFPLKTAVAQVFVSASESGSRGVEELQRQTVNILSFQKVPDQIFGAQLAFNLLSRLGSTAK